MANFRKRVKKKGKRWIKGQSSNSNPTSKIYRSTAHNNFFKENLSDTGSGKLTAESLRRHNNFGSSTTIDNTEIKSEFSGTLINSVETCTSFNGTVKTFNSFASDWTSCSNISFNKLINRFDLSNAHQKEMLAVLAAVTEVIKENGGTENTTEYFAALVTTLDSIKEDKCTEDSISAILSLLSMCIKHVPKGVLQLKFSSVSKTLMHYLKKYADSDHNVILKSLFNCLSVLLRSQEAVVWNDSLTFVIYDAVLGFIVHTKGKIRHAAHHFVCAVLKGSEFLKCEDANYVYPEHPATDKSNKSFHPAAGHTGKYCLKILEDSSAAGGVTTVMHIMNLLGEIIHIFPKAQLKSSCETILKIMTLKNNLSKTLGYQTLHKLFTSPTSDTNFPATLNAQLITALYDYHQPPFKEVGMWSKVMQQAFMRLAVKDLSLCISHLPKFIQTCTALFLSEKIKVINDTTSVMQIVLDHCVTLAVDVSEIEQYKMYVEKMFAILTNCLKYTYYAAWKQILFLLGTMYKICGKTCNSFMMDCLKSLAELRDSEEFPYCNEVDRVFGFAIETIGPQKVIQEIPLQITGNGCKCEIKRGWLLPLFKEYIKESSLKCFVDYFLPIAAYFRNQSEKLKKSDDKSGAVLTYDLLQLQIWSLLTSFSNKPSDISETFPVIAKPLGEVLNTKKELRTTLISTLRKLVNSSLNNESDKNTMARFAKNYIPILFNLYTTEPKGTDEEAIRFSAFDTIKVYLLISDPSLQKELFDRALQKLESEDANTSKFVKESVLDLTRVLLQYQSSESIKILYDRHIAKVIVTKNFKEEKKYYRLLEDLCAYNSDGCVEFIRKHFHDIKNLLLNSLSKAAITSRGPRIRCLTHLLNHDSGKQTIFEYIPETVLCCKNSNIRCRNSAFELICKMARKMFEQYGEVGLGEYLDALTAGLIGSSTMIAASVLALTFTVYFFKDNIIKEQFAAILKNICLLATSLTREIVGPCLGFIKLVVNSFNVGFVSAYLELIVKTLSSITEDCKRKYRQKMRDLFDRLVRKFGGDLIISLVPTHDGITITRLKALKKLNSRNKRKKEESKELKSETDAYENDLADKFRVKSKVKTMDEILAECDEDESDDDETVVEKKSRKKSKKENIYLQEDADSIIDFIGGTANITTTPPDETDHALRIKKKPKQIIEFETAPDGRIIILEEIPEKRISKRKLAESDEGSIASDAEAEEKLSNLLNDVKISRKRKNSLKSDDDRNEPPQKYQAGGSGIHRATNKQSVNDKNSGKIFKGKKGKGDVKKKGMPDPYAYIPLSRNALNRRKKKKSVAQFKNIVQSAKKGAAVGKKNNFNNKRNKKK